MKYKRLKLVAILLLGIGLTGLQAQTMYVVQSNGIQTAYALNGIRKLTFSGGNIIVQKTDNSIGGYVLNGLRYLNFTDVPIGIEQYPKLPGISNLVTYPNPVTDVLHIDLRDEKGAGTLSILSLEGKVIYTQVVTENSLLSISMSHLPQGIYLCRYVNKSSIKTVKIIKQ